MRNVRMIVLAGAAIAGLTGLALAAGPAMHEMTVQVPGGGVAHVRYSGDVAPKIIFAQGDQTDLFAAGYRSPESPFAELDRITTLMDHQMAELMYRARLMETQAGGPLYSATLRDLPVSSSGYTFASGMSGNGYCMRSTQITYSSNGGAPKVMTRTLGNCGSDKPAAASRPANTARAGLQTISYKSEQTAPQSRHGI